jgi:predicted TPR repeat methyltransferase
MPAALDPLLLTTRLRDLVQAGRLAAARPLLAALHRLAPDAAALPEIEAQILLREDRVAEAIAVLDGAIAADPANAATRLCRADARMRCHDMPGAAADAAEAVCLAPRNSQAKAILGIVLTEMNQLDDAIACLAEAVGQAPDRPAYRLGLAEAQQRHGTMAAAAETLRVGIARAPENIALRIAAIVLAMGQQDFAAALALADTARHDGVADGCVFGLLGHALSNLNRPEAAAEAYAEALKLAPEDNYVRHLVRIGGRLPQAPRAPNDYLQAVFGGYAERFEAHLIGLGYRIPGLIRAALLAQRPAAETGAPIGPLLDLGCGTGLVGVALSDLRISRLVGVDISGLMLHQARAKHLYTELREADLEAVLADPALAPAEDWAVITAADVFCYFGDLAAVLAAAHARLRPGGIFIFSVEALAAPPDGWQLAANGRYRHGAGYLAAAAQACGFAVRSLAAEALRDEDGTSVDGFIVTLERVRHDG